MPHNVSRANIARRIRNFFIQSKTFSQPKPVVLHDVGGGHADLGWENIAIAKGYLSLMYSGELLA